MDTAFALAGLALAILVSAAIGASIRALAGPGDAPTNLATLFMPVVGSLMNDPVTRPVVRETEPVRWNFGQRDTAHPAAA